MPVKRSRNEMSKAAVAATNTTSQKQQTVKKHVHFGTTPLVIIPYNVDDENATAAEEPQSQPQPQACELWYTRQELQQKQSLWSSVVIQNWLSQGYGILLEHSYQQPHIQTQEYLHAFAALSSGDNNQDQDAECLRGLELALVNLDHARERSIARKRHRQAVLRMQRLLHYPTHHHQQQQQQSIDALFADPNAKSNDDKLAACSRQSSAAAKLFAMRMGRADAKVVEHGDDASLAADTVQRHWKRNSNNSNNNNNKSPSSSQSTSPSASYSNLASLICLESPCKRGHAKPGMSTLPIQGVVYGRCCPLSNSPTIATTATSSSNPTALVLVASTATATLTPTTILT